MTAIGFIFFYIIFLGFVYYIELDAGITQTVSGYETPGYNQTEATFFSLFDMSSDYGLLNVLLLVPALAVLSFIGISLLRGTST